MKLKIFPGLNDIEPLILKVHQASKPLKIATVHLATPLWQLQGFHITFSVVATLASLKDDPKELSRESFSSFFLSLRSFLG
jgi:hypothetical protein